MLDELFVFSHTDGWMRTSLLDVKERKFIFWTLEAFEYFASFKPRIEQLRQHLRQTIVGR